MFLVNVLGAIVNLDFNWIVGLLLSNIHYLFIFAAVGAITFSKKPVWQGFIYVTATVWAVSDFTETVGWIIFDANFLMLNTVATVAVLAFSESVGALKKHYVLMNTLRLITVLVVFNLFLRAG